MTRLIIFILALASAQASAATPGIELAKTARAAQDRGDMAAAIDLYGQALAAGDLSQENLAIVLGDRGIAYWRTGQLDRAIADFDRALALKPDYVPAYHGRAIAYRDKNLPEKAIADYDAALRLDPEDAFAYENRGRTALHLGHTAAAIEDLSMAVTLEPEDSYAVIWLHLARAWSGQDDAIEFSRNAGKLERAAWPGPLVDLFLGVETPVQVRTAAAAASDGDARRADLCEADFYIGAYHLLRRERAEARHLFQAAVDACPAYFLEAAAARAELENLGP